MVKNMAHIEVKRQNPGCLVQLIWFVLVGWWAGQLWMGIAWFLMATIIGLPLGITMTNSLPRIIALRETSERVAFVSASGKVVETKRQQQPFIIRAIYFLLVGWWLSALWMEFAFFLCATIIGMPLGFQMFDKMPAILTLRR